MSPRSRIVAAQSVLVAVLLAVVFVTLLRPENPTTLFEVEAPGTQQADQPPSPEPEAGGGNGGNGDREDDGGPDGDGDAASPSPAPPPTVAPPQVAVPGYVPGEEDWDEDESPTEDQYADTLSQLDAGVD